MLEQRRVEAAQTESLAALLHVATCNGTAADAGKARDEKRDEVLAFIINSMAP